jgi:hypothetical protein
MEFTMDKIWGAPLNVKKKIFFFEILAKKLSFDILIEINVMDG